MLRVIPHLDFSSLVETVAPWSEAREILERQMVIVPTAPFAAAVEKKLASRKGVFMGWDFLVPTQFALRLANQDEGEEEAWSEERLAWYILDLLEHLGEYGEEVPERPLDAFSFARALARQFALYGHFRPDFLQSWQENRSVLPPTAGNMARSQEEWQKGLWRKLRETIGLDSPAEVLAKWQKDPLFAETLARKFPRLLVLGSGALDPLIAEYLRLLDAGGSEIEVHILLPSLGYLADLHQQTAVPPTDSDPEEMELPPAHPLLLSLGKQAVGTFALLGTLDEQYTHWPDDAPVETTNDSLLGCLQNSVRNLQSPDLRKLPDSGDGSLQVHACFGPRREIETVGEEILRAFRDFPGLQPEEVHLVCPDPEIYRSLVESVLRQEDWNLPVQSMDLSPGEGDPSLQTLWHCLRMVEGGQYRASEWLGLLEGRAVQRYLGIDDSEEALEKSRTTLQRAGLTRGLGGSRAEYGTFAQARERVVAGRWLEPASLAAYPDGSFVLPVADQLPADPDAEKTLLRWMGQLQKTLAGWQHEPRMTAAGWAGRLAQLAAQTLSPEDREGEALRRALSFLQSVESTYPVDAATIAEWLEGEVQGFVRHRKVAGSIPLGRFSQLQNLPCRVMILLGMDDRFPSGDRSPAWDLTAAVPRLWDRRRNLMERQAFLDALLTPRDRLVLTAPVLNPRNRKKEPFSTCVDEVLRFVKEAGGVPEALVYEHRLHPFVPAYFMPDATSLPASFSVSAKTIAEALQVRENLPEEPFGNLEFSDSEPVPPESGTELPVVELGRFWRKPADAYVAELGWANPREESRDDDLDFFPMEIKGLEGFQLRGFLFEGWQREGASEAWLEARLRADRLLPPGELAGSEWRRISRRMQSLAGIFRSQAGPRAFLSVDLERFGVRLSGQVFFSRDERSLLAVEPREIKKVSHYWSAWLSSLLVAATGNPKPLRLFDEQTVDSLVEFPPHEASSAMAILNSLIEGYFRGKKSPLPYAPETSGAYAKDLLSQKPDQQKALGKMKKAWADEYTGYGEGMTPAAELAWRGRDPFADPAGWFYWGDTIAVPLQEWINGGEEVKL
ncbi:MAG: exodeoxyribonuclease V subunit gamma [Opitutales bacterium]|nr:exodeoxyribonuclease V subunit gamma [Opitutales bacterium]